MRGAGSGGRDLSGNKRAAVQSKDQELKGGYVYNNNSNIKFNFLNLNLKFSLTETRHWPIASTKKTGSKAKLSG